jgi:hypothetical protein
VQKIEDLIDRKINALYATLLPSGTRADEFVHILMMVHAQSWKLLLSMEFSRAALARRSVVRMGALRDMDSSRIRIIDMILLNFFEQEFGQTIDLPALRAPTNASTSEGLINEPKIDHSVKHIPIKSRSYEATNDTRTLINEITTTQQLTKLVARNDFFSVFYDALFVISRFIERGDMTNAAICRNLLVKSFNSLSSFQLESKKIEELIDFAIPAQKAILTIAQLDEKFNCAVSSYTENYAYPISNDPQQPTNANYTCSRDLSIKNKFRDFGDFRLRKGSRS